MSTLALKPKTETVKNPPPPSHLSSKMKAFWKSIFERKDTTLQPHEVIIFLKACEAHDRCEQARRILKKQGLTYEDHFKQPRSRPEIAIERDSRAQFAKLLTQIKLYVAEAWRF